jgi:EmrB/QacA subfamily drug resistance transporter
VSTSLAVAVTAPMPVLSARRRWMVLAVCASSMFLVGLDTTIVNVGLPAIGRGLSTTTRGLEWVVDTYTVVFASLLTTSGAMADRFGRRRLFRLGLVVFGLASLACAAAPTIGALVAARCFQGAGASMLSPVALGIVVNAMPDPRERARAIGVWASVFGLSMAAGPVTGGALIQVAGWRSLFWVNAPIIVVALTLSALVLPESRAERQRRLDPAGQIVLTVLISTTVAILIEGPRIGWSSTLAWLGYAIAALAAAGFVVVERRTAAPLVELSLFRRASFSSAVVGAVAVFVALNLGLLLNTLYLQRARGWSALHAGAATLPMALGATVCAVLSGQLVARVGPRLPLALAGVFLTSGAALLVGLEDSTPIAVLLLAYLLIGVGFGFANAPITNTAVGGLPAERAGVAGAITSTARQVGSAVGIAIAGVIVTGRAPEGLARASHVGWGIVSACGLFLFVVARAARA